MDIDALLKSSSSLDAIPPVARYPYAKSPPERVPGDKLISLPCTDVVKFSEVAGVTNLKPDFLGEKKEIKFATKNPPGSSHGWGGGVKIQSFIT